MSSGLPEQGVLDVTVELPAATQARSAVENAADLWMRGAQKFLDQAYLFPQLPQAGLIPAVQRYLEFTRRLVELNRDLTVNWVEAASALSGAVWEQVPVESAGDVARERPLWPSGRSPARPGAAEALSTRRSCASAR